MKQYVLNLYNSGDLLKMISFDGIEDIVGIEVNKEIDKIKLFELNENKDGRNLIKEYRINGELDETLSHEDTKIIGYEVIECFTGSLKFRVKFEMSENLQKELELWHKKRFLDFRLTQSLQDESIVNIGGGALRN